MSKSTKRGKGEKFPLWLHPRGFWCKKHKGVFHYFGSDRDAALKRFVREWDDIKAGRKPQAETGSLPLVDLVNNFLSWKQEKVDAAELAPRSFSDYHLACEKIIGVFGRSRSVEDLRPADFGKLRASVAKDMAPATLVRFITMTKGLFAYAHRSQLIRVPVAYGDQFDKPPRRIMRLERHKKGELLVSAEDFWKLHEAADVPMRCFLLLGMNCAFGAKDAADLTRAALEIKPGWIVFPRPKCGIGRKCPLWPETVEALAAVAKVRPKALLEADENLVFVTRHGNRWVRQPEHENKRTVNIDAFAGAMTKILRKVELSHRVTPYQLRRTFRTIADEIQDEPAIDVIIGHATEGMAAKYRQRIDDSRLEKIVGHVRKWLLAGKPPATEEAKVLA